MDAVKTAKSCSTCDRPLFDDEEGNCRPCDAADAAAISERRVEAVLEEARADRDIGRWMAGESLDGSP